MSNKPLDQAVRKWYQKKRYIIPAALVGFIWLSNGFGNSTPDTVKNYVSPVNQIQVVAPVTNQVREISPLNTSVKTPTVQGVTVTPPAKKIVSPAPAAEVPLSNDNTYINSRGNEVHSPAYAQSVPVGASAVCGDGTYSFSQSRRGTCSHHGGVSEWLN